MKGDKEKIIEGYAHLREAYNRLVQIQHMDNILAHAVRTLGAIEDTLYEYTTHDTQHKNQR